MGFETAFEKKYSSVKERAQRLEIFTENLARIAEMKVLDPSAEYDHLSPFADWSIEEFTARNTLQQSPAVLQSETRTAALDTSSLPESFDWRTQGAVAPVKNQEQCGSCWAFATVAGIEGANFLETKKLLSLSEQELVDCDKVDQGCGGGLPSNALDYLKKNGLGEELEGDYSYKAVNGQCEAKKSSEKVFVQSWQVVDGKDEDQLAAALVKYGPLPIGINASPMQMYRGGIANPSDLVCNPKRLDHGVAIVAFGVEKGTKYWVIKNSWGETWGEKGYYRVVRGKGKCGLNTMVVAVNKIGASAAEELIV